MAIETNVVVVLGDGNVAFRGIKTNDGELHGLGLVALKNPVAVGTPVCSIVDNELLSMTANEFPVKIMFKNVKALDVMMHNLSKVRELLLEMETKEKEND